MLVATVASGWGVTRVASAAGSASSMASSLCTNPSAVLRQLTVRRRRRAGANPEVLHGLAAPPSPFCAVKGGGCSQQSPRPMPTSPAPSGDQCEWSQGWLRYQCRGWCRQHGPRPMPVTPVPIGCGIARVTGPTGSTPWHSSKPMPVATGASGRGAGRTASAVGDVASTAPGLCQRLPSPVAARLPA